MARSPPRPARSCCRPCPTYRRSISPREQLIQALGLSFTVSTLALAAALAHSGAFNTSNLGASAIALVPALIGMQAGTWLRPRIDPGTFRMLFFAGCVALGVHLAL